MLALSLLLFSLGSLLLWIASSSALSHLFALTGTHQPEPFDRLDLIDDATRSLDQERWNRLSDWEASFEDRSPRRRSSHHHVA